MRDGYELATLTCVTEYLIGVVLTGKPGCAKIMLVSGSCQYAGVSSRMRAQ